MEYTCKKCNTTKNEIEFYPSAIKNYCWICIECDKKRHKNREKNYKVCPICQSKFCLYGPQKECSIKCRIKGGSEENESGCWIWKKKFQDTYPKITINKKDYLAHRISYEENNEKINEKDIIEHFCKNPKCVNPAHLKKTTIHKFNKTKMQDTQKGEDNYFSKLKEIDVKEIRRLRKDGYLYREIAEMYEVSIGHIGSICRNTWWNHI